MTTRASEEDVRNLIDSDSTIKVSIFIRTASILVDKIDSNDSDGELSANDLMLIETWLAAHFYAIRDQQYSSKKTGDASGVFQGQTGMALDSTFWGQQAMTLDTTGYLSRVNQNSQKGKQIVGVNWLGKPPSSQTDYEDRD